MSLFTSSSDPSSFRGRWSLAWLRPFIAALLLLALYQGLIWLGVIPPSSGINQWQENVIQAESYLYEPQNPQLVLVGSSLAANLNGDNLADAAANLAMAGGCSQTGLAVLLKREPLPEQVLVEVNDTIDRRLDQDFISRLTQPILRPIRQQFSSFRSEYTPLSVIVSWLKGSDAPEITPPETVKASPLRQQEITRLVKENQDEPDADFTQLLTEEVAVLQAQIDQLTAADVDVILFSPPVEPELEQTPRQRAIAQFLQAQFPDSDYHWLPAAPGDWLTSDGLHLTIPEVERYSQWLQEQM